MWWGPSRRDFRRYDAGTLALAFAADHPERTRAVVVFQAAPRWTRSDSDDYGFEPEALGRFLEATQEMDAEAQLSIIAPHGCHDPIFQFWFRRYDRSARSGITADALGRMMATIDTRDRLPRVEAPVLVLNRSQDQLLPMPNARALAGALPNARLVELPGRDAPIHGGDVDEIADEIQAFLTGTRPLPRLDRVLATVLFTDIVGSTDRAARAGDRDWLELLERHNRILRASLDRFGGKEVHTAGDGFLATFDSPRRAIECARAAGEAVRSIGMEIRAGVHTGEIELSDADVQGIAVHIGRGACRASGACSRLSRRDSLGTGLRVGRSKSYRADTSVGAAAGGSRTDPSSPRKSDWAVPATSCLSRSSRPTG